MIAVLIVGILAGFSFRYYQDYSLRAHRVDARNALLGAAQKLQLYFLANNKYPDKTTGTAILTKYGFDKTPASGATRYEIEYHPITSKFKPPVFGNDPDDPNKMEEGDEKTAENSTYFLLAKVPEGSRQSKDKCKQFVLSSRGIKEAYNTVGDLILDLKEEPNKRGDNPLPNECWR